MLRLNPDPQTNDSSVPRPKYDFKPSAAADSLAMRFGHGKQVV